MIDLATYHWNNLYGESDSKLHEEYYLYTLCMEDKEDLIDMYNTILEKAGSWNGEQLGKFNVVIKILNQKYPKWRVE